MFHFRKKLDYYRLFLDVIVNFINDTKTKLKELKEALLLSFPWFTKEKKKA